MLPCYIWTVDLSAPVSKSCLRTGRLLPPELTPCCLVLLSQISIYIYIYLAALHFLNFSTPSFLHTFPLLDQPLLSRTQPSNQPQLEKSHTMDSDEVTGGYSAADAEEVNDLGAASYDSESYLTQTDIQHFIALADLQLGDRVLDLGCGNAIMTIAAKLQVGAGRVVGVDISSEMLRFASRRVEEAGLAGQIELLKGNIEELSALAAESAWDGFDVILCRRVICNLQDRQVPFLRHIASFLAPGGRIVTDQTYPYQFIATAQKHGVPGEMPPPCIKLGIQAHWEKIEDHFRQQVQVTGLTVDIVRDMNFVDGIDVSAGVFAEAQRVWTCSGENGPMPAGFHELAKLDYLAETQPGEGHLEYATILCRLSRA
jgi:ubiquinone/menaquinone biosynthesis C-methylase UbiE